MSQFKLIALEPLEGCEKYIIKNLEMGKKYYFYQGYEIKDKDTIEEDHTITLPSDFFSKGECNISIHAIVGRNGSGKSAIIELLMRVINNLSFIHNGAKLGSYGLVPIYGVAANLYFQIGDCFYKIYLPKLDNKLIVNATIKELNNKTEEKEITQTELERQIQPFFYTIINNYSFYAYNIRDFDKEQIDWSNAPEIGINNPDSDWINGICHKNDGYSTPIVVNPMRTDGNIDINKETQLTRSRLLSMLVDYNEDTTSLGSFNMGNGVKRKISKVELFAPPTNNHSPQTKKEEINDIKALKYKLKILIPEINQKVLLWNAKFDLSILKRLSIRILNEWGIKYDIEEIKQPLSFEYINDTIEYNYIVAKTMDIINTYSRIICPEINDGFYTMDVFGSDKIDDDFIEEQVKIHVLAIENDNSHISLKIKQALNYLKYTKDSYKLDSTDNNRSLSVNDFSKMIGMMKSKWGKDTSNILYFLPPSFVKFEIYFTDDKSKEEYPFKLLSSGEKQLTYFITTILYHLRNLDSAFYSKEERAKYDNINIILEEIELYFHPEMQRVMVNSLITNIQNMNFKNLKAINICLCTHSPIILSDIPKQNILYLENGKPTTIYENTFGANIYSLYKHSFFMNMPMGEFAKSKIEDLFEDIRNNKIAKEKQETIMNEIKMVGEPLLKNQLLKLYNNNYNIKERVSQLEKELENLKKQLSHDKD
jgi:predicted ATPase